MRRIYMKRLYITTASRIWTAQSFSRRQNSNNTAQHALTAIPLELEAYLLSSIHTSLQSFGPVLFLPTLNHRSFIQTKILNANHYARYKTHFFFVPASIT